MAKIKASLPTVLALAVGILDVLGKAFGERGKIAEGALSKEALVIASSCSARHLVHSVEFIVLRCYKLQVSLSRSSFLQ